jgi:hypothetical protein
LPSTPTSDGLNDVLSRMPSNLSAICNAAATTPPHDQSRTDAARSRSASLSLASATAGLTAPGATDYPSNRPRTLVLTTRPLSQASSISSFNPCASIPEMSQVEQRMLALITQQGTPTSGSSPYQSKNDLYNASSQTPATSSIPTSGLTVLNHLDRAYLRANTPLTGKGSHSHASGAAPLVGSVTSAHSANASAASAGSTGSSSASSSGEEEEQEVEDNYPIILDEECAICLFDFEHGEQLRHLPCDHFFHLSCVDRWLVRNPFCPKCKRCI